MTRAIRRRVVPAPLVLVTFTASCSAGAPSPAPPSPNEVSAILDYFAPLSAWLDEQLAGKSGSWQ